MSCEKNTLEMTTGETRPPYGTVPVCMCAAMHRCAVCCVCSVCVCVYSFHKTVLNQHAWCHGNHTINLPICPQQPWLIEHVRGDESNQKTAESQSRGKSAVEERRVTVNVSIYLLVPQWLCGGVGGNSRHFIQKASLPREALINEPYLNISVLQGQDNE